MPSFDIVNRLDHQEIDNALGNATREITTRYDFKGSEEYQKIDFMNTQIFAHRVDVNYRNAFFEQMP